MPTLGAKLVGNNYVRVAAASAAVVLSVGAFTAGTAHRGQHPQAEDIPGTTPSGTYSIEGLSTLYLDSPTPPASSSGRAARPPSTPLPDASALAADGIPSVALNAYGGAAASVATSDKSCGLSWPLLAAIGRVESDHGRSGGAILRQDGRSTPQIIGIPLDGHGTALIRDTDRGRLDHDVVYDNAVGPMQFIPSTWAEYGVDADHDHHVDAFDIFDAALAAAHYLCAAGGDLTTLAGQVRAIRAYNDSDAYLKLVLQVEAVYAKGVAGLVVPTVPAAGLPATGNPGRPAVDPGPPLGLSTSTSPATKPTPSPSPSPSSASTTPTPSSSPTPSLSTAPTPAPTPTATDSSSTSPPASTSAPPTSSGLSIVPASGSPTSRPAS